MDAVVVIFLVLVFAEYAKIRGKAEKQFTWIAGAGIFFLLAAGFELEFWGLVTGARFGSYLFQFLGWLWLLIGVLWGVLALTKK